MLFWSRYKPPRARCRDRRVAKARSARLPLADVRKGSPLSMSDTRVDFSASAILRKWPSVNKERVSASLGARPYMIIEGTLDECIQQFMQRPEAQRHLYEIHTAPQSDLVSAVLSTDQVAKLARLRDFLGK